MNFRKRKHPDINDNDGLPMEVDMQVDEVAEGKLFNGKVSKSCNKKLEEEYGTEWKEEKRASKIHMIPCIFTNKGTRNSCNGTKAECALYNALKTIDSDKSRITYYFRKVGLFGFVFHGLIFDGEEIDFVFLTIYGLMIVECKGITSRKNAQRRYEDACNQLNRKTPKLVGSLGLSSDIPILKVVSFPLLHRCDIEIVDETCVLFEDDLNDIKTWLRRSRYLLPENAISFEKYVEIATVFLKKYHLNGTDIFNHRREFKTRGISDCNDKLERTFRTKFYTKEQAMLLNVDHCEDMWVTGAAGTGKTLVLKDLVKKLTERYSDEDNKKILVITYNVPINKDIELWVEKNIGCKIVRVQTFSALLGHILQAIRDDSELWNKVQRMDLEDDEKVDYILEQEILKKYFKSKYTNTSKYRHILVDEAQDLPGKWLTLLDAMLNKKEKSNLWVFEDPFQVVRRNTTRPENGRFSKHSLTKVFRNTHNIFEAYQHCHESLREEVVSIEESFSNEELSSPSVDHDVYGLRPEYIIAENDDQLKDSLLSTLKKLHSQGVPFCDVAVITCATEVSYVTGVLKAEDVKCENADKHPTLKYSTRNKGVSPVIVDSYQRFKGLESKVLIFFIRSGWTPRVMDIYVGFSRSFCHLVVIGTSRMINNIKPLPT